MRKRSLKNNLVRATKDLRLLWDPFLFLVTVYVIESLLDQTWYRGMAVDAEKRGREHDTGKNPFTKSHMPWKIIFTASHPDWESVRKREKNLESAVGKTGLKKYILKGVDTSSNLTISKN